MQYMSLGGVSTYPLNHRSRSHSDFNILAQVDMFTAMDPLSTAMDPLARFHADRYNAAWKTIKEENACRFPNYVKLFDAGCSVSQSERRQLHVELEANLPSVSERLDCPRLKTFDDRYPRWVPPRSRTPSPAPRYGRGEGGRRIQSPEAIRIIRAQSGRTMPPHVIAQSGGSAIQPNTQPRIGTSLWPENCDNVVATVAVPGTIRGVSINGLAWGNLDVDQQTRLDGLVSEMKRVGTETFRLQDMLRCDNGTNMGHALSAMMQRIESAVAKRQPDPMQFKIGITWNPPHRWANPKYGYMHDDYHHMEILAWDFRGAMIGLMEASLILHFQKEAPLLCLNKKIGDNNRQDITPQFLYVVYMP